jgi:P27 family predicted phage terminase small subunit
MAKRNNSKKYADYKCATQSFMNAVENHLISKFGGIKSEWQGLLTILAQQYDIFEMCKESIRENGMMVTDRFGALTKNPLLKVQTDSIIQIKSIAQEFGLSPKSIARLNVHDNNEDDFIDALIG